MVNQLSSVFPSAIILDDLHVIRAVSSAVLSMLKYSEDELVGKDISVLAPNAPQLIKKLCTCLVSRPFHDYKVKFVRGCGRQIPVSLSGFNFRNVSNLEDLIVLKVHSLEELQEAHLMLQKKTEQLDQFLYRASHDLRGPIATIKGILNLATIRKDDSEVNLFFDLIAINAEKLDQELRMLMLKMEHPLQ